MCKPLLNYISPRQNILTHQLSNALMEFRHLSCTQVKEHKYNSAIANLNFENNFVASIVATDGLIPIGSKASGTYILHILCIDIIMRVWRPCGFYCGFTSFSVHFQSGALAVGGLTISETKASPFL